MLLRQNLPPCQTERVVASAELADLLGVLGHCDRIRIIEELRFKGPMEVCEIRDGLEIPAFRLREAVARSGLDLHKSSLANQACPVLWIGSRAVSKTWKSMVLGVGLDGFRRVLALLDGLVRERSVADRLLE